MTAAAIVFTRAQFDAMLAHVLSNPALEMCGLLAGRDGRVDQVWPTVNVLNSSTAYRMDGPEFVAAMIACDFEPLGIFHSHPAGPDVPSPTDIAEAAYPDSVYIIISLRHTPPSVRAFTIVAEQVDEVMLDIGE